MRHSKGVVIAIIALATIGWTLLDQRAFAPAAHHAAPQHSELPPRPAPDVIFTQLDGGTIALHSLKGRQILLHFWASWCAPCRAEFETLLQHIAAEKGRTVLLAVSADAQAADAQKFLRPYRARYPDLFAKRWVILAHDPQRQQIEGIFQTYQYPETIIIDPDLHMRRKVVGMWR